MLTPQNRRVGKWRAPCLYSMKTRDYTAASMHTSGLAARLKEHTRPAHQEGIKVARGRRWLISAIRGYQYHLKRLRRAFSRGFPEGCSLAVTSFPSIYGIYTAGGKRVFWLFPTSNLHNTPRLHPFVIIWEDAVLSCVYCYQKYIALDCIGENEYDWESEYKFYGGNKQ